MNEDINIKKQKRIYIILMTIAILVIIASWN